MTVHTPREPWTPFEDACARHLISNAAGRALLALPPAGEALYRQPTAVEQELSRAGLVDASGPTQDRSGWIGLTEAGREAQHALMEAAR